MRKGAATLKGRLLTSRTSGRSQGRMTDSGMSFGAKKIKID